MHKKKGRMIGRGSSGLIKLDPRGRRRSKLQFLNKTRLNAGRRIGALVVVGEVNMS
jgi:hypothetical protein